ncbi:uncharacterized protein K452DRAFT_319132, partial [Aplosporella prunicola CBS 121167]
MSPTLHHECTRVPVTALTLHGSHVFAADGPFLRIYNLNDSDLLATERIFRTQAIHGFVPVTATTVLVYGGQYVRLVELIGDHGSGISIKLGPATQVSDWVLAAASFRLCQSGWRSVLVTAHNALILLETGPLPSQSLDLKVLNLTPSSRCILYSADVDWMSETAGQDDWKVLVASGTAFGEILIWSCSMEQTEKPQSRIHHFFTGHEGSIFGVQISPQACLDDVKGARRLLASCSDDRTIRLWDITDLPEHGNLTTDEDPLNLLQDRETGFGANVTSEQDKCLATAWGHTSRVWAMKFAVSESKASTGLDTVRLVSFGEDATSRIWRIDSGNHSAKPHAAATSVNFELVDTKSFHSGKNIWAMDVSAPREDGSFTVVTGGADSAIVTYQWPSTALDYTYPEPSKDAHRCYAFLSSQELVSATNSGQVIKGDVGGGSVTWHVLGQLDELKGFSVAASIPSLGLVFLAGSSGQVYCHKRDGSDLSRVVKVDRKVAGLYASTITVNDEVLVSLTVAPVGAMAVKQFLLSPGPQMNVVRQMTLQLPPKFVVTSALYVAVPGRHLAFVGARHGSVAAFTNIPLDQPADEETHAHTAMYPLQNPETVTSMTWIAAQSDSDTDSSLGHLVSVGRNGRYTSSRIFPDAPALLVHQLSLPFGPNVEGAFIHAATGRLMVYGFRGRHFVLVNTQNEQEVFSIECGGAHRIWAFCPGTAGGTFVWQQAATMKLYSAAAVTHGVVSAGGHGREIKALTASPADPRILATGAEDTTIRVFERDVHDGPSGTGFRSVRVVRKHVTGIQDLQWSPDGRFLFSCGGNEEFFVWRVRRVPVVGVGVVCEAECPSETELSDLRIMGFAVRQTCPNTEGSVEAEAEADADAAFVVAMVYSDSSVRVYAYTSSPTTKLFRLLSSGTYLTSCLTQCAFLSPTCLLTGGTDGHIALWPLPSCTGAAVSSPTADDNAAADDPDAFAFAARAKMHQSAIKTLALAYLGPGTGATLLLTGGDDNALGLSLVRAVDGAEETTATKTLLVPRAHAATITACALVRAAEDGDGGAEAGTEVFWAVTAGNDQRVRVWRVSVDVSREGVEGVEVQRVRNVPSAVADVAGLVVVDGGDGGAVGEVGVVVAGVGMEAWTLR